MPNVCYLEIRDIFTLTRKRKKMKMMKKLAMLVAAIILGGLGYAAYQRYAMQSDNVLIQKGCKYGKDKLGICKPKPVNWKDVGNDIQDALTIDKGAVGYSCTSNSDCSNSNYCYKGSLSNITTAGTCQKKLGINKDCNHDGDCKSTMCSVVGQCQCLPKNTIKSDDGYQANSDTCCSGSVKTSKNG